MNISTLGIDLAKNVALMQGKLIKLGTEIPGQTIDLILLRLFKISKLVTLKLSNQNRMIYNYFLVFVPGKEAYEIIVVPLNAI